MLKRLIRFKVYFDTSKSYWGYGTFFMILLVLFESKRETAFGIWYYSTWWAFPAFVVLFLVCSVVFGYFILKYIRPHEQSTINKRNPELMEILKILKDDNKPQI